MPQDLRKRIAVIDYDLCNFEKCGFYLCEKVCPVNRMQKECIKHEQGLKPAISEELCVACLLCVKKCPFKAITVENLSLNLKEPIHQYGKNSFRLYRLPVPKEKSIVGLLGQNGCGKTTCINILSGSIVPNLGDFSKPQEQKKIIEYFKGKEIQAFFKKLYGKKMRLALKQQNITELSEIEKSLEEWLKEKDERKILQELEKKLDLKKIMQRKLSQLSGGELQRAAIATAIMQNAELYFFDEPSNYLDVSERLKVAKILRELALEKSVIVIEHDLAVLDYLSDTIHLFFGTPGAFGVISNPKTVKAGINEFLEGYLKDENLRFRSTELKFDIKPPSEITKSKIIAEYPKLQKSLGSFRLETNAGIIKEGEVLGILGPNAIGKTTFVKMLAGLLKADNKGIEFKKSVSYKPQYISAKKGVIVRELFNSPSIDSELFNGEVKKRLNIEALMEKSLDKLSGGELQRVAIALCLSRANADLYLLDEPSAFLDVEQRLQAASCIRRIIDIKKKAAFVVDHDILFQDFVSNRIIVFEGIPGIEGKALEPKSMRDGMNSFLKMQGITMRRDAESGRPRINKQDSVLDQEQKKSGEYFYGK
ncbi:MAG: ribosome biogenesis/translation initiation ATPase RLI [Candidatus Diapherotrites archaeon]|nr:ribosome biogenesis/translation initiation ATPase RLI [Candidatus Diapherotrites archaeon]